MSELHEKLRLINTYVAFRDPPIDVIALANVLGLKVYNTHWPDNVSGKIQKDLAKGGPSGFAIFVNKTHSEERKRFTIAHEIAHYVLHESQIGDGIFDDAMYRSGLSSKIEAEANGLAADILMPWSQVQILMTNHTIEEMARHFKVSVQAMTVRLGIFA
ncbi:ImmA/IrrE family metallo-endopeptidase [Rhizobium sp. DKSPLA3]|uniref:ImmA/IrrE family metallo-endopeptidase n=1 Tax=Rhizobium quercicola TaxID=2901226 RepID=A0A9X1NT66_9HYPH|nr:ImmA/IrrE family metallo-endopeptidase [Rhizobium quercicola]MCD7110572.1 ImmA/IrrE family metallo-endopeptidase [Rhizobium quercicola]